MTSHVEHSIETGDAKPIKRNPYRTPHTLKSVVEEHIDDMFKKNNNIRVAGCIHNNTTGWLQSTKKTIIRLIVYPIRGNYTMQ